MLDAASYVWLVWAGHVELEFPVTLDKSGLRGTFESSDMDTVLVAGSVGVQWQSHLLEIRGLANKKVVSNTVTVELANAAFGSQRLDLAEIKRQMEDRRRQMTEEIRRRSEDRRRRFTEEYGDLNDLTPDFEGIPSVPRPFRRPRVE